MKNTKTCFIALMDGYTYIIPVEERENFDGTAYYDRRRTFSNYILGDDAVLETVEIEMSDFECLINGDFD